MGVTRSGVALGLVWALAPCAAVAQATIANPTPLNTNWSVDFPSDLDLSLDTDRLGTIVAVWREPRNCRSQVAWSRSQDRGASFSPVGSLGQPQGAQFTPAVATDRAGNWVVVWDDRPVRYVRSTDNGLTWSQPASLGPSLATNDTRSPSIAADDTGTFIVVWHSNPGSNEDIFFSRSVDHGATWSPTAILDPLMASDSRSEQNPSLVTDGSGTWLATWYSYVPFNDPDRIEVARSTDGGATWPLVQVVSGLGVRPTFPVAAGDGQGRWVVAWNETSGPRFSVSHDNAGSWHHPGALDSGGSGVCLETDGLGTWLAIWSSLTIDGTPGGDSDLAMSVSHDGTSWSAPAPLEPGLADAGFGDSGCDVVVDDRANWTVAWQSSRPLGMGDGTDRDFLKTVVRIPIETTCATDLDGDGYGDPGDPSCPLGSATDCDDLDIRVAPGSVRRCDGVNNDCDDPAWPSLAGTEESDDDGDGFSECQAECDDANAAVWFRPAGEVGMLVMSAVPAGTVLEWQPPPIVGGNGTSLRYDVLRSTERLVCPLPGTFDCIEAGTGPDTTAVDTETPEPGVVFFYLVRATNACPGNYTGPLGTTSSGNNRWVPACSAG